MMIINKNIFFLGLFILATQYLFGLPTFWKTFLISISVLLIIFLSVIINIPRRNPKIVKRKEKVTPVFTENYSPVQAPVVTPTIISVPEKVVEKPVNIVDIKPKVNRRASPKKPEIV